MPFKSGCRTVQLGDVCEITFLCCFYFLSFNDSILKLGKLIYRKLKLYLCVMSGLFCLNPLNLK